MGVSLGAILAVNFAIVLGLRTGQWDANDYFAPYFSLVADAARQGEIVTWSPLVNGGCPVGFEPQVGAASPLVVFMAVVTGGTESGFRLYWLTLWCLGGIGVLVLAGHLGTPPWIACIAAIGYAYSAIYTGHAEHTSYLATMSLFPWVLWRLDVALGRRSLLAALQAGALWGLSALGGYPALVLGGAGYLLAWSLGRMVFSGGTDCSPASVQDHTGCLSASVAARLRTALFTAVAMAACYATGFVVLAPTYAGFLVESRGYTSRGQSLAREAVLASGNLPPAALSTFASPYLSILNSKSDSPLWTADVSMTSIYVSPLLLVLALSTLAGGPERRFHLFLITVGLGFLVLALGGSTPIYGWLYDLLPPLHFLRFSAPFRCYYIVTVAVLAAMAGADLERLHAAESQTRFWRTLATMASVVGLLAVAAFAVAAWLSGFAHAKIGNQALAIAHLAGIWSAVALLGLRGLGGDETSRRRIVRRSWVVLAIVDAALTIGLTHKTVYGSIRAWKDLASRHVRSLDLTSQGLSRPLIRNSTKSPLCSNLITKTPELVSYAGMINAFHERFAEHKILGPSALGPERIWFADEALEVPLTREAFDRFAAAADRLGRPAIVVSNRSEQFRRVGGAAAHDTSQPLPDNLTDLGPAQSLPVTLIEYTSNRLAFEVQSPRDGWLLATDRWAQGWHATVNNKEVEIWIGNFIFRAVRVARGLNRVDFTYRPFGHPWLLLLSWTTLAAVAGGSTSVTIVRLRRPAPRPLDGPETSSRFPATTSTGR